MKKSLAHLGKAFFLSISILEKEMPRASLFLFFVRD